MQQLQVEHKKTTKDRREGKGRVLALSRRMYRLQNTDVFYVESESSDNIYCFVKYNPSQFEWCSCKDYEANKRKGFKKCKHIFGVEFAIRWGTLKETDKLPADVKKATSKKSLSWKDDDYSF